MGEVISGRAFVYTSYDLFLCVGGVLIASSYDLSIKYGVIIQWFRITNKCLVSFSHEWWIPPYE